MDHLTEADFASANDDMLNLILTEGDKRLAAQGALMLAADTRASGVLAAAVALAAAGIAVAAGESAKTSITPLLTSAAVFGIFAIAAAVAAVMALWPTNVQSLGWNPALFVEDMSKGIGLLEVKAQMCAQLTKRIRTNRACASGLSLRIRISMLLLVLAPIIGALAGALTVADQLMLVPAVLLLCIFAVVGYVRRSLAGR
jgi:hypothetical protein